MVKHVHLHVFAEVMTKFPKLLNFLPGTWSSMRVDNGQRHAECTFSVPFSLCHLYLGWPPRPPHQPHQPHPARPPYPGAPGCPPAGPEPWNSIAHGVPGAEAVRGSPEGR